MSNALPSCAAGLAFAAFLVVSPIPANAESRFDGGWNLVFITARGPCDPTFSFTMSVTNGYISNPNISTFRGRVALSGAAYASVRVGEKYASGSGRLSDSAGGIWS